MLFSAPLSITLRTVLVSLFRRSLSPLVPSVYDLSSSQFGSVALLPFNYLFFYIITHLSRFRNSLHFLIVSLTHRPVFSHRSSIIKFQFALNGCPDMSHLSSRKIPRPPPYLLNCLV